MPTSSVEKLKERLKEVFPYMPRTEQALVEALIELAFYCGRLEGFNENLRTDENALGAHASDADRRDFDARR